MIGHLADALAGSIDWTVRFVVHPVTSVIPFLVRTGLLFLLFLALWAAFLAALWLQPAALDAAWQWLTALPLPVQALAWLLFLPVTGALWVWSFDWPLIARVLVVVGIAGWNLLVFLPRREASPAASVA